MKQYLILAVLAFGAVSVMTAQPDHSSNGKGNGGTDGRQVLELLAPDVVETAVGVPVLIPLIAADAISGWEYTAYPVFVDASDPLVEFIDDFGVAIVTFYMPGEYVIEFVATADTGKKPRRGQVASALVYVVVD